MSGGMRLFHVKQSVWQRSAGLHSATRRVKMFHVKPEPTSGGPTEAHIRAALDVARLGATDLQVRLLAEHAAAVLEANQTMNLTRIVEAEPFVRLHVVDSLMPLKYLDLREGRLIDVGSGAGFPGIPLAVMGCAVTLCEARKKKASYLERWAEQLGLDVSVLPLRVEEIKPGDSPYDWVVMRAVSSLGSLVELAYPLLGQGGHMVAMKAHRSEAEEAAAARAAAVVGMESCGIHEYVLPGGTEQRALYVYRRTGTSRVALPRRAGLAQTQPLG